MCSTSPFLLDVSNSKSHVEMIYSFLTTQSSTMAMFAIKTKATPAVTSRIEALQFLLQQPRPRAPKAGDHIGLGKPKP